MRRNESWTEFLGVLSESRIQFYSLRPFRKVLLKRMCQRYGEPPEGSVAFKSIATAVNVLPVIYAQVYFPAFQRTQKQLPTARLQMVCPRRLRCSTINWRHGVGANTRQPRSSRRLVTYNSEHCRHWSWWNAHFMAMSVGKATKVGKAG